MREKTVYILLVVRAVTEPEPRFEVLLTNKGSPTSEELCKIEGQSWFLPSSYADSSIQTSPDIVTFDPNVVSVCSQENTEEQICQNMVKLSFRPDANCIFLRTGITTPDIIRPDIELFIPLLCSFNQANAEQNLASGNWNWISAIGLLNAIRQHYPIDGTYSHYIVAVARTLDIYLIRKYSRLTNKE